MGIFNKFKDNVKKTWETINFITSRNSKNHGYPEHFVINDVNISDYTKIANEFNKFYVNLGPHLDDNICPPQHKSR